MSAIGTKRTFPRSQSMSDFEGIADIDQVPQCSFVTTPEVGSPIVALHVCSTISWITSPRSIT
jgi:hypothetical protein